MTKHMNLRSLAAAVATSWLCLTPVWADDTEIFFGDIDSANVRPNVLFIIDTSGSMDDPVGNTGKDRLDHVKDAFDVLLSRLTGVNVGLMRFSNPGGPVLYPVSYLDQDVNTGGVIDISATVDADNDDAMQGLTSRATTIDDNRMQMVILSSGSAILSDNEQIDDDEADTEERISSGDNGDGGSQLDFFRSNDNRIGLRFDGMTGIPPGATVVNAYIRFTGRNDGNSNPVYAKIWAQQDDSGDFDNVSNYNLANRIDRSKASVDWDIPETVSQQTRDTPNIKVLVQQIIDNPVWHASGNGEENDMVFIFEPRIDSNGERDFYSRDGSTSRAPYLYIDYYTGAGPTTELSTIGLRFQDVNVPKGATITSAQIQFTAGQDGSGAFAFTVWGEDSSLPVAYAADPNNISSRTKTSNFTNWTGSDAVSANQTFESPSLAGVVQEIAARGDWCGGNDMAFVIDGSSGLRDIWAHDGSASKAAKLTIQYDYDSVIEGASCSQVTINKAVAASSDDVEESGTSGTTTGNVLNMESGNLVGVRFNDINIPQGSTIQSAYLEFTANAGDSGTTQVNIAGEEVVDAAIFVGNDGVLEDRSYFSPGVDWTITSSWSTDNTYRSVDIASIVRKIVGQGSWAVGNSLSFKLTTSTNTDREAITYNQSPLDAPRLIVTFQDDGTAKSTRSVRDELLTEVDNLNHAGWTPIQDTLYEAATYMVGNNVVYGTKRGGPNDGGPHEYTRVSHANSMVPGTYSINRPSGCSASALGNSNCAGETITGVGSGPTYESPITNFCQRNSHIILLTDGQANLPHSDSLIETFIGGSCANENTKDPADPSGAGTALDSGETCVKSLVSYIKNNDLRNGLPGDQVVTTHTIGFNFSSQWLKDVATAGGGTFNTADNADQLATSILQIIGEALKTDATFVAPVAAVNQFNRLNHLSEIYFAVFRPSETPDWRGNLKKYALDPNNNEILDSTGASAVDPSTGFFAATSQSLWSATVDGTAVAAGGAAAKIPAHTSRKVYTYYAGSPSTTLSNSANLLTDSNTALTKSMFGVTGLSDTQFALHLNWIRGKNTQNIDPNSPLGETRLQLGDPLHSKPIAITYGSTEANPQVQIFMGTNHGAIHAIDADDGVETFAFYPEAMLPMQNDLRTNSATTPHPYGIDGSIVPWAQDNGNNGIDITDPLDFVRIYTGMRRGGMNYYGLDVTDLANPKIMWTIEGGAVAGNGDDFTELGQTWSKPVKAMIKLSGDTSPRDVLIFTGGYDDDQDNAQLQTADTVGRAIYIVDALTGTIVWSGGKTGAGTWDTDFADMDYSIPASLSVGDTTGDGLVNAMFVADVGGQLWRFDIRNGQLVNNLVSGGVVAELGLVTGDTYTSTENVSNNRRFYHTPSVALVKDRGDPQLAVAVGSGFHAHPLSVLALNRMHVVRQNSPFSAPGTYTKLTAANLYNATANRLGDSTLDPNDITAEYALLNGASGWYFDMTVSGEKVLSSPLITGDSLIFTTYAPGSATDSCSPAAGTSRAYQVHLADARPSNNWDGDILETPADRYTVLQTPSIVDEPTLICTGAGCKTFLGTEDPIADLLPEDRLIKTYWRKDQ